MIIFRAARSMIKLEKVESYPVINQKLELSNEDFKQSQIMGRTGSSHGTNRV